MDKTIRWYVSLAPLTCSIFVNGVVSYIAWALEYNTIIRLTMMVVASFIGMLVGLIMRDRFISKR